MNFRKNIIYVLIIVLMFVLLIGASAFAYFAADIRTTNVTYANATLPSEGAVCEGTGEGEGTVTELVVASAMASEQSDDEVAKGEAVSTAIKMSTKAPDTNTIARCTYDLVWTWNDTGYTPTADLGILKELTYTVEQSNNGSQWTVLGSTDVQFSGGAAHSVAVLENDFLETSNTALVSKFYRVKLHWFNISLNQDIHRDKLYGGTLGFSMPIVSLSVK